MSNRIWNGVSKTLGFEPKEEATLIGASGHRHQFTGLGFDEKGKRVLAYSGELDPRMAAMVHSDAAANLSGYQLVTVRPVTFDLRQLATLIRNTVGTLDFDGQQVVKQFSAWADSRPKNTFARPSLESNLAEISIYLGRAAEVLMPFLRAATLSGLSPSEQIIHLVREVSLLDLKGFIQATEDTSRLNLAPLASHDALKWDRQYGVCPFPLYELKEDDWEKIRQGTDEDWIRTKLSDLGISQYFKPPNDHAALAVIDHGLRTEKSIQEALDILPAIGHPIADNEFLSNTKDLSETMHMLKQYGYMAEGDIGMTITEAGKEFRASVKFRPREGVFAKLLARFNVNVGFNPKDFM